jgi:ribonuclease BN (tRNA processing enzyme)
VKITLVPSSVAADDGVAHQFLTSYLVNDTLAVDAGCLGLFQGPRTQGRVQHVLISHTHMDHIASLPLLVENAYRGQHDCITIHGSRAVLECLCRDIFNDRVWPDFLALSVPEAPFMKFATLEPGQTVVLENVKITAVAVDHVVPTCGFILDDGNAAVVISSDTGPTEELWRFAGRVPHLKAAFLEATFPNSQTALADLSKHLTPATFAGEVRKLHAAVHREVPIIAVHIKARYQSEVTSELHALGLPALEIGQTGRTYLF